MTGLEQIIRAEIARSGPISTAHYMQLCLGHPTLGYYTTRDPLGSAGDFTTAPEISQMFGEMLGVWAATAWTSMACPDFSLIELGPGRGTLMADMLRVLDRAGASPQVWMVETSPALRAEQARRVPGAQWANTLADVPEGPAILIANEFLDALPVHQYLRTPTGWREQQIGLVNDALAFGLSEPVPERNVNRDWFEVSPLADSITDAIVTRLKNAPGAALLIDYGYTATDMPDGLTLQALRRHQPVSPLHNPGECDLTWLIDFDRVGQRLGALGIPANLIPQGPFLASLGIGQRAQSLAQATPDQVEAIADALERLTAPDQMGTLFKVLGAVSPGLPTPPGFES